jgi:hypothetical protein
MMTSYTGYTNFIHLKASLTVMPTTSAKVLVAMGDQWRQSTRDAVCEPSFPLAGAAGAPGRRSATYAHLRYDSSCLGAELRRGW